jgi:cytochrome c oxidase subunit 2
MFASRILAKVLAVKILAKVLMQGGGLVLLSVLGLATSAYGAEPQPWQLGLQPAAGSIAEKAADLHNMLLVITGVICVLVLALLIYTCIRFHEDRNPKPSKTTHSTIIEVIWTVVPVIILVVIAVPSFKLLYYIDRTDETDMVVKVTGAQWYWTYEYPEENIIFDSYMIAEEDLEPHQKRLLDVDNPLVVPEGTRIKLLVEANDVMHSFFMPALAIQVYTVAGRTNEAWLDIPMGAKTYYGQCNQICGINHSYMPIVIKAVSADDYKIWVEQAREEFAASETIEPIGGERIQTLRLAQSQ